MKKKILLRGAIGFPVGVTIGHFITILLSLIYANGYYSPCEPKLISAMGNEINAVMIQTFLCGLLGIGFGAGSIIWEIESWGIIKQTGVYFLVVSIIMMPVAWFSYWMEHSIAGFFGYFLTFVIIFIIIWIIQFFIGKHNIQKINENLYKAKR